MKSLTIMLFILLIIGCSTNDKTIKLAHEENENSLSISSADLKEFNESSPIYKLKNFFDSIDFKCDTVHLYSLDNYAYVDLRKTHFTGNQPHLYTSLNRAEHSMSHNDILIWGRGYYYTDYNRTSSRTKFRDLGIEFWEIDTTKIAALETMETEWKENYYPMPIYFHQTKNHLYVVYARSMAFDDIAKRGLDVIKGS